ncbi:hypothetical protein JKA74_06740 [Marivirga sp. S37H4]|uniref:D-isomer specific 2-hydroxyacid dehydrogenase NAD-binding domain-containing protein n=1 Tax=Marivirga aurantiaca TaxID=2802615 RepID=A0A934WX40_9BACT|nr:NAD(P)-dependent oxidoreductase [Marivirga aurantiaca]MBK6264728.1 hypothetical protein [Marivirga aurantiaca]
MNKKTLLTSGKLSKEFKGFIDKNYKEIKCLQTNNPDEIAEILPEADFVAGFNFLEGHNISHLKWIHSFGAGVDSFLKLPIKENCHLSKTTGKMGKRMAEYCLAFVLEDLKQLLTIHENQQNKKWSTPKQRYLFQQNVYILGTGYVGTEIAKLFNPLTTNVTGVNSGSSHASVFDQCYKWDDLKKVGIPDNSIIINTLPLTAKTINLLDKDFFENLRNCMLVNIGRAGTIKETDLITALSNHNIRKAILDVFNEEPLSHNSPLWHHSGCIVTPHLAGPTSIEDVTESFTIAYNDMKRGRVGSQFVNKLREY